MFDPGDPVVAYTDGVVERQTNLARSGEFRVC